MNKFCRKLNFPYIPFWNNFQIVQYLIEKGDNIEANDNEQKTPLHLASFYGKTDIVRYLDSKGANKMQKTRADTLFVTNIDEIKELLK